MAVFFGLMLACQAAAVITLPARYFGAPESFHRPVGLRVSQLTSLPWVNAATHPDLDGRFSHPLEGEGGPMAPAGGRGGRAERGA